MQTDSLYDVEPGDMVLVCGPAHQGLAPVDRITDTLVVVGLDKYRKSDGYKTRNAAGERYVRPLPPDALLEFKAKAQHQQMVQKTREIDFESLSNSKLQIICDIATLL